MSEKPVLLSRDDPVDLERFRPQQQRRFGPDYIPGYTERVMANDIAKGDPLWFREYHKSSKGPKTQEEYYREIGAQPGPLAVELKWLRVTGVSGGNSYSADMKLAEATEQMGFRLCTKEDLRRHGYGMPPAAHEEPDGTIRRLDVALYIRHGDVARWWAEAKAADAAAAENARDRATLSADGYDDQTGRPLSGEKAVATVTEKERDTITVKEER